MIKDIEFFGRLEEMMKWGFKITMASDVEYIFERPTFSSGRGGGYQINYCKGFDVLELDADFPEKIRKDFNEFSENIGKMWSNMKIISYPGWPPQ